jgi:enoyl-CoA hydratase
MIERSEQDGIVTLRMAHGKVSAMDLDLVEGLMLAFDEAAKSDARAVILTGSGSSFSAGVDLFRFVDGGPDYVDRFLAALSGFVLNLFAFEKPLVAAVNGHSIAGGCVMTCASDIRLMAAGKARIGVPEMLVGVPFPPVVLELLRFSIAPQTLQTLIYTGRTVTAGEAKTMGIIDEVVEPDALQTRAEEQARQLAALPADAFRFAKRQLRDPYIRRARRYENEYGRDIHRMWSEPETHGRIREYLARTVGKK